MLRIKIDGEVKEIEIHRRFVLQRDPTSFFVMGKDLAGRRCRVGQHTFNIPVASVLEMVKHGRLRTNGHCYEDADWKEPVVEEPEEPKVLQPWEHNCPFCTWVSWINVPGGGKRGSSWGNMYLCESAAGHKSVIIRFSDEPDDYWSSPVGACVKGSLQLAPGEGKNMKCVNCGREYTESNGYGYCLQCEEGTDHDERNCHESAGVDKKGKDKSDDDDRHI